MTPPAGQYFRAGVGAVITDGRGLVLALERAAIPGAWQFPQGGLEPGEEPPDAVLREIAEETAIPPGALRLVATHPEPLAYELPAAARSAKTGRGQVQYWFLFECAARDLALPAGGEFRAWRWRPFAEVLRDAVPFRRAVYERVGRHFGLLA